MNCEASSSGFSIPGILPQYTCCAPSGQIGRVPIAQVCSLLYLLEGSIITMDSMLIHHTIETIENSLAIAARTLDGQILGC